MHALLQQRSSIVSASMDFGPAIGPQIPKRQSSTTKHATAYRPNSGNAASVNPARRGQSGAGDRSGRNGAARFIRALAALCLLQLAALAVVQPALADYSVLFPAGYQPANRFNEKAFPEGDADDSYEARFRRISVTGEVMPASAFLLDTEFLVGNTKIRFTPRSGTTPAAFAAVYGANAGIGNDAQLKGAIWNASAGAYVGDFFILRVRYDASASFPSATNRDGQRWSGMPRIAIYEGATEDPALGVAWEAAGIGTRNWTTTSPSVLIGCKVGNEFVTLDAWPDGGAQDGDRVQLGEATTSGSSGALAVKLIGVADFEAPGDDGGDNLYKIRVVNKHNLNDIYGEGSRTGCSGSAVDIEIEVKDAGPPAQVSEIGGRIGAQNTTLNVDWNAPTGFLDGSDSNIVPFDPARRALGGPARTVVTGYDVRYRAVGASNWIELTVQSTSFDIADLSVDANYSGYQVQVRARNGEGAGEWTDNTVGDFPWPPRNFQAANEGEDIALSWDAPITDGGSAILRYEVRLAAGASVPGDTAWTSVGLARTHTVSGLSPDALHSFEVRAVNGQGAGLAAQVQATPAALPAAPQGLFAAPGDSQVVLRWQAPSSNGSSAILRYEVRHAEGASVPGDTAWTPVGFVTTHTVSGLANGALHSFEVRAVNGQGAGPEVRTQATPVTVPAAPQGLSAAPGDSQVVLRWQAPASSGGSDLVRYEVRHAAGASVPGDMAWTSVGLVTTHTVSGLANGALHSFEVRAVNGQGAGSEVRTQETPAAVPAAPQGLSAARGDSQVVLRWQAPANNGGSDLVRYEVRHAAGASVPGDTPWTPVGLATTHTVSGLANGALHSFEVRAVNGQGAGPEVRTQATPVTVPAAPQELSAAPGDSQVVLRWQAPASSGGSDLVRYEVRHAAGASVPGDTAWTPVGLATTHTVSGLANGALHSFEVRAVNGLGAGSEVRTQATPAAVPAAPQGLSAARGDSQVVLRWQAPANNGGSDLVRYEVRHAVGTSVPGDTAWTPVGLVTTHTVSGLANGALHSFEVRAVNGQGAGPEVRTQATPVTVPAAPQGLSTARGDSQVVLRWQAPASSGGSDLVRYEVRHAAGASVPGDTPWTPVGLATTHTVSGLANGALHSFEVRAVNGQGAGPEVRTQETPATVPAAPQGLSTAPGGSRVVLRWQAPANNGGSDLVRYEVRHAAGASVPGDTPWTPVGLATTHTVSGLANGALHSFEVRAVNGQGAGPEVRTQETPAPATVPATVPAAPQGLSAAPGDSQVVLRWQAPASNGRSAILRYEVRHAEGASVPGDTAWTPVGLATMHTVSGLANGALHSFEVRAVNGQGAGSEVRTQATPVTVPAAPQELSAAPGDSQVVLRWQAPASSGGSDLVRYEVRHAEGASVPGDTPWTPVGLATTHTVSGLANGALHSFEVRAVNGQGAGPEVRTQETPATVPAAPQGLSAAPGDSQVVLRWQAPASSGGSDLVRYEVRHAAGASVPGDMAWTPVGLATMHTVSGLANGALHSFEVRAVNGQGAGPEVRTQETPATVPAAPQELSAAPGDSQVVLRWQAPASSGGSDLVRYEVRHAAGASVPGDTAWTPVGLVTTYTVSGLANGALHSFEVRAVNGQGAGPEVRTQETPATVPAAPQGLSTAPGDSQVVLRWQAPASSGGSDLVRYEVRHAAGASVPGDTAWTPVGLATTHTVSGLANGALHSFEVRAVNGQGAGPEVRTQETPATVPAAPQGLSAAPGDSQVVLRWQAPASNGGSDLVRYEVRHAAGASVPGDTAWTPVGLATTHTVSGLANGALHSFEVRAVNGQGAGPEVRTQETPATVPAAPQELSAAPGDSQVVLRWQAPASSGGSDLVRYEVRHAAGASVPGDTAWTPVGLVTTYTVSGLANGALHSFEVRAVNGLGAGPEVRTQATPATVPAAPQGLSAAPGDSQVVLRWQAPASSGGSDLVRYEVRHAAGASVPGDTPWTPVGLATTHTVSGLANGVLHSFEVRAVNRQGAGSEVRTQATPVTVPAAPQELSAAPGDSQVVLRWQAPANNGGSDLVRYEVRHAVGTSVPDDTAWTPVTLARTYTVSGLTNGVLCAFEVRAVNGRGSGPEVLVQATPRGNGAPVFDADAATFRLEETRGAAETQARNVGRPVSASDPEGERVTYGLEGDDAQAFDIDAGAQIRTKVGERYSYETGSRYTVTVWAQDESGARARKEATIVLVDVDEPPSAPQAPRVDPASGDGKRLNVRWHAGAQDGVPTIVGYDVQYREVRLPQWTAHPHAGAATVTQISGLTPVTRYEVRVRARNEEGVSPWSAPGEGRTAGVGHEYVIEAWLPRFGRTVAEQNLESIESRMSAARKAGVEVRVAGQPVGGVVDGPENGPELRNEGPSRGLSGRAAEETDPNRRRAVSRAVTERELQTGSSFALTAATGGEGLLSVWGRGAVTQFAGSSGDVSLDGEVSSGVLGADWTRRGWTAGLLVSHSVGDGGYRETVSGEISSTLTAFHPWVHHALNERVSVWGVAGYGEGSLTLAPDGEQAVRTDLELWMAASGLRGVLLNGGPDGLTLATKADAMFVRTASDMVSGPGGHLAAAQADTMRLLLALEGSRPFWLANGAALTPSIDIGVRHDGGDAETGFGADLGGSLVGVDRKHGLSAELRGRGLLTHEAQGFRKLGAAGSLAWDPQMASDRGPRLTLTQSVGASARGGVDALLGRRSLEGQVASDRGDELQRRRLEAGFAYGFAAFGDRFISTSEIGVGLSDAGRDYRLGWRLTRVTREGGSLEISVEARRREIADESTSPEHDVRFGLTARY